jgi:hypothetical protein
MLAAYALETSDNGGHTVQTGVICATVFLVGGSILRALERMG